MEKKMKKSLRKKKRTRKKKPFMGGLLISFLFLFFSFFALFVYFIYYDSFTKIKEVELASVENFNEEELRNFIMEKVEISVLKWKVNDLIIISTKKIEEAVLKETSVIEDVVVKKSFPATLKVKIKERVPYAVWCVRPDTSMCAYVDKNGVAFQRADKITHQDTVFIRKTEASPGDTVISIEDLEKIKYLSRVFGGQNLSFSFFEIDSDTVKVIMKEGWNIYFSAELTEQEVENLILVLREIDETKGLQYIDLRFGDRVFYK
jgi:hypothetical protein